MRYFLDEMKDYEVSSIIENIPYLDINEWERHRFQIYSSVQMNSKKQLSPTDIMKFKWDNEKKDTEISNDDIERLKKRSEQISKIIAQQQTL